MSIVAHPDDDHADHRLDRLRNDVEQRQGAERRGDGHRDDERADLADLDAAVGLRRLMRLVPRQRMTTIGTTSVIGMRIDRMGTAISAKPKLVSPWVSPANNTTAIPVAKDSNETIHSSQNRRAGVSSSEVLRRRAFASRSSATARTARRNSRIAASSPALRASPERAAHGPSGGAPIPNWREGRTSIRRAGGQHTFAFLRVVPPRMRRLALHEARDRDEYVEHARVETLPAESAEPRVEIERTGVGELRGRVDAEPAQIVGGRLADVGQVGESDEPRTVDLAGVHA